MTRNLIYHITPTGCWQRNLELLKKYSEIFNGVKLAVVAQGAGLESLATISGDLDLFDHIWPMPNDPELRETPSLVFLLSVLPRYTDIKEGITFFAHTKGVTRGGDLAVTLWTELCYKHNLHQPEVVDQALRRAGVAGCFRRFGRFKCLGDQVPWHFSGTFYWLKNSVVYSRNWEAAIRMHRYGAEAFPGVLFDRHESVCLFADNCENPYKLNYIQPLAMASL